MKRVIAAGLVALACLAAGCRARDAGRGRELVVFHASNLTALMEAMRPAALEEHGILLYLEPSGSQVACRKLTELNRACDLLVLADAGLVRSMLAGHADWRIDFAADEMVLAVGARAPAPDEAERDWVSVLTRPEARLGRVDENLGPTGYRTLLTWQLQEAVSGPEGLFDHLLGKTDKVVDHVTRLAPLLRKGEIDYGFVYRSLCHAWDLRYIRLDRRVNLGDPTVDYSGARVTFTGPVAGREITVAGAAIAHTLTIPNTSREPGAALDFARLLLTEGRREMAALGYRPLERALFYGRREDHGPFEEFSDYAGEL